MRRALGLDLCTSHSAVGAACAVAHVLHGRRRRQTVQPIHLDAGHFCSIAEHTVIH